MNHKRTTSNHLYGHHSAPHYAAGLVFNHCLLTVLPDSGTATISSILHTAVRTVLLKKKKKNHFNPLVRTLPRIIQPRPSESGEPTPPFFAHFLQSVWPPGTLTVMASLYPRTFGLSIPSAWNSFPRDMHMAHFLIFFFFLCISMSPPQQGLSQYLI